MRVRTVRLWLGGTAFVLGLATWAAATPVVSLWLKHRLSDEYPPRPAAAYPAAEAIVVLGGGVTPPWRGDWLADETDVEATRLGFGMQLFREGKASRILLSGGKGEAPRMAGKLIAQGLPAGALTQESASMDTHQNAVYSAAILRREHIGRILLVTSTTHMRRAMMAFEHQGMEVIPAPAYDPVPKAPSDRRGWLPARASFRQTVRCTREYLGLLAYRILGWA